MAIHAHSTPVPAPQRGLLRAAPTLATVEAEFAGLIAQPWPAGVSRQPDAKPGQVDQVSGQGTAAGGSDLSHHPEALSLRSPNQPEKNGFVRDHIGDSDLVASYPGIYRVVRNDMPCRFDIETPTVRSGVARHAIGTHTNRGHMCTDDVPYGGAGALLPSPGPLPGGFDLPETGDLKTARALHARRDLHQALDFGFALLDALDLSPLALDVIDDAIARLDALDAPCEDLEPSLGWTESGPRFCGDYQDCELDTADWEPSLASPERHPAVPVCFFRGPHTARGGEEGQLRWAEGSRHDGEAVNEDGDELDIGEHDETDKEPSIGWPNDFQAVLDHRFQAADTDVEEVNEDGDDCGEAHAPWWDRIGYTSAEGVHG